MADKVMHLTLNQGNEGSIPSGSTVGDRLGRIECWYSCLALNEDDTGSIPVFPA